MQVCQRITIERIFRIPLDFMKSIIKTGLIFDLRSSNGESEGLTADVDIFGISFTLPSNISTSSILTGTYATSSGSPHLFSKGHGRRRFLFRATFVGKPGDLDSKDSTKLTFRTRRCQETREVLLGAM